jgi:hypothetical protein
VTGLRSFDRMASMPGRCAHGCFTWCLNGCARVIAQGRRIWIDVRPERLQRGDCYVGILRGRRDECGALRQWVPVTMVRLPLLTEPFH